MEPSNKKYSGFIDGLKASNISTNKTSLEEYSEQILHKIAILLDNQSIPLSLKDQLFKCESTLKVTIKNETVENIINSYIKFGDIFYAIIPKLKSHINNSEFQDIAIYYLQIAKLSTDSRITNLAISIAKEFE